MSDVTEILQQIEAGDPTAADLLLPMVYDQLRQLAAARMSHEPADHTLQATELVHEAYVRLVDQAEPQQWNSRRHFFMAAAEAMRRILVEHARRKKRFRHGGDVRHVQIDEQTVRDTSGSELILAVDESLEALSKQNAEAAELVKLRYFGGLTLADAAAAIGVSPRTADRLWAYAKAWLHTQWHP